MSTQNEMRRVDKTNLEFKAKRLREEIKSLCETICINLDCSRTKPEDLPIVIIDGQFDELKAKWGEIVVCREDISRIEEALK